LQTSKLTTFSLCSGVLKRNVVSPCNARINSCSNASTSCKNMVNIGPVTSEFKKEVCGSFAAIEPQFDDRCLFCTLAFQNGLKYRNFDFRRLIRNNFFLYVVQKFCKIKFTDPGVLHVRSCTASVHNFTTLSLAIFDSGQGC